MVKAVISTNLSSRLFGHSDRNLLKVLKSVFLVLLAKLYFKKPINEYFFTRNSLLAYYQSWAAAGILYHFCKSKRQHMQNILRDEH